MALSDDSHSRSFSRPPAFALLPVIPPSRIRYPSRSPALAFAIRLVLPPSHSLSPSLRPPALTFDIPHVLPSSPSLSVSRPRLRLPHPSRSPALAFAIPHRSPAFAIPLALPPSLSPSFQLSRPPASSNRSHPYIIVPIPRPFARPPARPASIDSHRFPQMAILARRY